MNDDPAPTVSDPLDFDALVSAAREMPPEAGQLRIWTAAFLLPRWHFVAGAETTRPFTGTHDGQSWIFAFTDEDRARRFALELGLVESAAEAILIAIATPKVVDYLTQLGQEGVHGIRFNNGPRGWFAPLSALPDLEQWTRRPRSV